MLVFLIFKTIEVIADEPEFLTSDFHMEGCVANGCMYTYYYNGGFCGYIGSGSICCPQTYYCPCCQAYPPPPPPSPPPVAPPPPPPPPTIEPIAQPTVPPSLKPSVLPTAYPTLQPSIAVTSFPTLIPVAFPTLFPTALPSSMPTVAPSSRPSNQSTLVPSALKTPSPTASPTVLPTQFPPLSETINKSTIFNFSGYTVVGAVCTSGIAVFLTGLIAMTYFRYGDDTDDNPLNEIGPMYSNCMDLFVRSICLIFSFFAIVQCAHIISRDIYGQVYFGILIASKSIVGFCWFRFMQKLLFNTRELGDQHDVSALYCHLHQPSIDAVSPWMKRLLYTCIVLFSMIDLPLLRLLPWSRSAYTKALQGYPNSFAMKWVSFGTFCASLAQIVASFLGVFRGYSQTGFDKTTSGFFVLVSLLGIVSSLISSIMYIRSGSLIGTQILLAGKDDKVVINPNEPAETRRSPRWWSSVPYAEKTLDVRAEQLRALGEEPADFIPLDELKAEMAGMYELIFNDKPYDERRKEYLDRCLDHHPDYKAEIEEQNRIWREEVKGYCVRCLQEMRSFIPTAIFTASETELTQGTTSESLRSASVPATHSNLATPGLSRALLRRFVHVCVCCVYSYTAIYAYSASKSFH